MHDEIEVIRECGKSSGIHAVTRKVADALKTQVRYDSPIHIAVKVVNKTNIGDIEVCESDKYGSFLVLTFAIDR